MSGATCPVCRGAWHPTLDGCAAAIKAALPRVGDLVVVTRHGMFKGARGRVIRVDSHTAAVLTMDGTTDVRVGEFRLEAEHQVHYGTANGPACGSRFAHDGLTAIGDVGLVTCARCKRSLAFRKDAGLGILS